MRYGYHGETYSYRYQVKPQDVKVDQDRKVLVITAKFSGYGKPEVVCEFPILRVRLCEKCGEPVSIYAGGDLKALQLKMDTKEIFNGPTSKYGEGWRHLQEEGGFALVAVSGHKWERGSYSDQATCHGKGVRVLSAQPIGA
jgi:hypothetical protein